MLRHGRASFTQPHLYCRSAGLRLAAKRIRDTQTYVQIGHNFITSAAKKKKTQRAAKLEALRH